MTEDPLDALARERYHRWYYDTEVWTRVTWLGVPCWKSVSDLWSYQEILFDLKPSLAVEFGTNCGGSALFFADVLSRVSDRFRVLTVDIDPTPIAPVVRDDPKIEVLTCSSTDPRVRERIRALRAEYPGPCFAILDSDHAMAHVLEEMLSLRDLLRTGDVLIVEDGNLNGNPVRPDFGAGPQEAVREYERRFPQDYAHDLARERKFGFTFAPHGFLVRR